MSSPQPRKRGLTYGRLLTVMGAAIALAVILAAVRAVIIADHLSFAEIDFERLVAASYDRTELTRAELEKYRGASGKIQGTVIYVKTSEGHYAKLAVEFGYQFWNPTLQFVIYQGGVFDRQGRRIGEPIYNKYMLLVQRFDIDAGRTVERGASPEGVDLAFVERTVADQSLIAVNGAAFALPKPEELRRR
ncbi:MAG: hypothetical protein NZ610_07750 [Candidatus Bipolaricaulota bacterium]|nr:hypothetical protein [Candidatus Bipolaricaulota bacterium]MCS7275273.1 hypothetical protein [Candidatus Bipolaricaulota bacterium]MDW8111547.1 hypothetical protein [Candidatus Bipolaricaulota bacterium]MDW8329435.1 hypothetical protein [Candidatus Bipolaricaulota bacterium]